MNRVDLETSQCSTIGEHEKPVKSLVYHSSSGLVISGSWDKTVKLYDHRNTSARVSTSQVPHKVFSMDSVGNLLVVGMAGRAVHVYDIRNMTEPFQRRESSLKYMTRTVRCIPTGEGVKYQICRICVSGLIFD